MNSQNKRPLYGNGLNNTNYERAHTFIHHADDFGIAPHSYQNMQIQKILHTVHAKYSLAMQQDPSITPRHY